MMKRRLVSWFTGWYKALLRCGRGWAEMGLYSLFF
jgi:hypothetical protein